MPFVTAMPLEDMLNEDAAEHCARDIADDAGDFMERSTKAWTPVSKDVDPLRGRVPGTLEESIRRTFGVERTFRRGHMAFRVRVQTFDPVAPHVEWNTKPHIIRPRKDRRAATVLATGKPRGTVKDGRAALSFRAGGVRFFARVVHHPGTQGHHMFALGALETEIELDSIAAPALRRFARDLTRSSRLPGAGLRAA